jgi:flagellar L-ring protein FlgH
MSMYSFSKFSRLATTVGLLALSGLAGGCSAIDRLSAIGETPKLASIDNPTTKAGYKPVQMPMPTPQPASYSPNSLWRTGSRAFFKDQRAAQVGDILTITVNINDTANWANETQRSRKDNVDSTIANFFGAALLTGNAAKVLPGSLLSANGDLATDGKGTIVRQEALATNIAAVVTQILPNGNLVVEGKQDIRVNYELRELIVAGIVRPEDIQSDNTIDSSKIAEARISIGARGQIMDLQQPRYGNQVSDILLPF